MDEALGLLDALESLIVSAKRIPFSDKVVLEERKILGVIDKLRKVVSQDGMSARQAIDLSKSNDPESYSEPQTVVHTGPKVISHDEIVLEAKIKADKIKSGANEYADYVLANIAMMLSKMQKNMVTLERNVESGREVLAKTEDTFAAAQPKQSNEERIDDESRQPKFQSNT